MLNQTPTRATYRLLASKPLQQKKSYVYKNYLRVYSSSTIPSLGVNKSKFSSTRATVTLFTQWFKLNSTTHSNFNKNLNSPLQNLILPVRFQSQCFNVKALFSRWLSTFHLLYTLFTHKTNITIFSNAVFMDEVNTLNYFQLNVDYRLFSRVQPSFYFSEPSYGLESLLVFTKLLRTQLDTTVITDVNCHKKTLFYLQSINSYTIGLVPGNYNQWVFSYPIPTTLESFLPQYFFLKWFHLTQQLAARDTAFNYESYWTDVILR